MDAKIERKKNYFITPPEPDHAYCPKCNSGYIRFRSRRKYFIKAGVYASVLLFCGYVVNGLVELQDEAYADATVSIGALIFVPLGFIMTILMMTNIIKGLLKKAANYKCAYCKAVFTVPFKTTTNNVN